MSFKDIKHAEYEIEKWDTGIWDEKHNKEVIDEIEEFLHDHERYVNKDHEATMDALKNIKKYFVTLKEMEYILSDFVNKRKDSDFTRRMLIKEFKELQKDANLIERDFRIAHKLLKNLD